LSTTLYLVVGWASAWTWLSVQPALHRSNGLASVLSLVVLAGVLHTVGAVVYARRWPDPWPSTFGYHEVFHALVVLGNLLVSISVIWLTFA
jgi:hemolysin III